MSYALSITHPLINTYHLLALLTFSPDFCPSFHFTIGKMRRINGTQSKIKRYVRKGNRDKEIHPYFSYIYSFI